MVAPEFTWDSFETNQSRRSEPVQDSEENMLANEPAPKQIDKTPEAVGQQPKQEFNWGQFDTTTTYYKAPKQEETGLEMIGRNLVSNTLRLGEQTVPPVRFGNAISLAKTAMEHFPDLAGPVGKAISEFVGPEKWKHMIHGDPDMLGSSKLPTSEDIKNITDTVTGGYTKPKGPVESAIQEFSSDVGLVLQGKKPTLRHAGVNYFGIPLASNAVKQTVNWLGFGEDKADIAKTGTQVALSLLGNVNGREWATKNVSEAQKAIPGHLTADLNRYLDRLDSIEKGLLHSDPRTKIARESIQRLRQDIMAGRTGVQDLFLSYDGVNATKRSSGMFEFTKSGDRKVAAHHVDQVRKAVGETIRETAHAYPEAMAKWQAGMKSLAVIHDSQRMTNWIANTLKGDWGKVISIPAAGLFGAAGAFAPITSAIGGTTAAVGYKLYQTYSRVWNDPKLANYYWNAISAAQQQNTQLFIKNFQELNKGLEEKQKKKSSVVRPPGQKKQKSSSQK